MREREQQNKNVNLHVFKFALSNRYAKSAKINVARKLPVLQYLIVFSFVTKCGQTIEFLLWGTIVPLNFLVGYHCSIVASTPQPMAYASIHTHTHTHTHTQTCKHRQTGSSHCSSFVYTLTFSQHLSYVLYTFGKRGPFSNWGPYCSFCYKSPVWMPKQTHTHTHTHTQTCKHRQTGSFHCSSFVYTLTFSQHLSYVLYTFGKRGAFFQRGTLLFLLL